MPAIAVPRRSLDAHTRIIAIIGDPIEHTKTPIIQNTALEKLGLNVINVALRVKPEDLKTTVSGAQAMGFLGLMVTIPHKIEVLALADTIDPLANMIGAANLLHFRPDGAMTAYNTDAYGISQSLNDNGVEIGGKRFLVLGAGGAARCAAFVFARENPSCIILANRTRHRADELASETQSRTGFALQVINWDSQSLNQSVRDVDVIVNATSVGMVPHQEASPLPDGILHRGHSVFDMVYNPIETRLLKQARESGARTIDGIGMLVYTNERAVEICCDGAKADVALMREACISALWPKNE